MCARAPRERRTSENSVKAKFVERHHSEDKRCMLASLKSGADFSRGCAGRRIGNLLFATHPHHVAVREWFYASSVSGGSRHSESVFIAPIYCTGHKPQGGAIGHSPPA